jgi:hypothetical protein
LALPVLSGTILQSIKTANLDFGFTGFGLSFLFFGAVAFWMEGVLIFRAQRQDDGNTA